MIFLNATPCFHLKSDKGHLTGSFRCALERHNLSSEVSYKERKYDLSFMHNGGTRC